MSLLFIIVSLHSPSIYSIKTFTVQHCNFSWGAVRHPWVSLGTKLESEKEVHNLTRDEIHKHGRTLPKHSK